MSEVWSIFLRADAKHAEQLAVELWELGTAGIIEEADGLRAFFEDSAKPEALRERYQELAGGIRREEAFQPQQTGRDGWAPILIGESFFVTPPWVTGSAPLGRHHLKIDDANAFGSGRHESTQLVLEALEKYLKAGDFVVDVGCGSGILSVAASVLGAGRVLSCDVYGDAIQTARRQMRTPLFIGSADAIRGDLADLVFANITASVLDEIADELKRIVKPSGYLILAGFIREDTPRHFQPREVFAKDDWLCWIC